MGQYYETFYPPFFMDLSYRHNALAQNRDGYDRADTEIVADIQKSILRLRPLELRDVQVASQEQLVTLTGSVPNQNVSDFLTKMSDLTLGVRNVVNRIQLKRAGAEVQTNNDAAPEWLNIKARRDENSLNLKIEKNMEITSDKN